MGISIGMPTGMPACMHACIAGMHCMHVVVCRIVWVNKFIGHKDLTWINKQQNWRARVVLIKPIQMKYFLFEGVNVNYRDLCPRRV